LGPELTAVGARRAPAHIRESLLRPGSVVGREYELYEATLADGRSVEGIRLNEDSFTIQLRDLNDRLHTFDKADLAGLRKLAGRSWMSPVRLDAPALDDLVAYLVSLEGKP
jgi:putative heme-binding domain-containing protein